MLDAASTQLVESLSRIDTTFVTSTVLDVAVNGDGIFWQERQLAEPFTKRYTILDTPLTDQGDASRRGFIAATGDIALGVALTCFEPWNRRQVLTELLVDQSARRRGVARGLLDRVLNVAAIEGAREEWLETQNVNVPAIRAYQAMGFRITGCDTTLYDAPNVTERAIFLSRAVSQ